MIATLTLFRRLLESKFMASMHTGHGPFKMWFKFGTAVDTPVPINTTLKVANERGVPDVIIVLGCEQREYLNLLMSFLPHV